MKKNRSWKQFFEDLWFVHLFPFLYCYKEILLVLVLLTSLSVWGGVQLGWFRPPLSSVGALEAVPASATIIFETKSITKSLDKISKNQYFEDLKSLELVNKWHKELASLQQFLDAKATQQHLLQDKTLVAAAQINGVDQFDWLFVLDKNIRPQVFFNTMDWPIDEVYNYLGQKVYRVKLPDGSSWSFCAYKGLLLFSKMTVMVEAGVEQLNDFQNALPRNPIFRRLNTQSGQSDLSIYVNFSSLPVFLSMLSPPGQPDLAKLGEQFSFLGLDSRFEDGHFVMSGHLYQDEKHAYWNWLANQPTMEGGDIAKLLPENIAIATYWNLQSFPKFYRNRPAEELHKDFDRYILPWLGDEAAYFITEPTSVDFVADKFVLLKTQDSSRARQELEALGNTFGILDTNIYQGFVMQQLAVTNLLDPIWGGYLKPLENPYYIMVEDYVLFCNSASVLELWIDKYKAGKMIQQSELFKGHLDQMQNNSSLYLLINTANVAQLAKSFMREEVLTDFDQRFLKFRNLTPLGIQLTAHQGHFLLTISTAYNSIVSTLKTNVAWRRSLKAEVAIPPVVVKNHNNNEYEIFTQDVEGRIYLLSRAGQILWEKVVDGKILSKVAQIDFYENAKLQYAFNTARSIYIFDRNGELVKRIPLVSKAINGLLAINYGKGVRLFVACADGRIYGFDKYGKPLSGWNPNRKFSSIQFPFVYHEIDKEDYMIAMNRKGKLFFAQRNGDIRFTKRLKGYYLSNFVVDKEAQRVVAGASNGKIQVVNFKGKSFGIPAPKGINKEAHFAHADVAGDERLDFIRQSQKRLTIHAYDTAHALQETLVHDYDLVQDDIFPVKFVGRSKQLIGSYNAEAKKLYIIDARGQLLDGFPLMGSGKFEVLDLFHDNNNTLLVANGQQILAYKLKY